MGHSGDDEMKRRAANERALTAFGIDASGSEQGSRFRCVRSGNGSTVVTIGYERRDGDGLVSLLWNAQVEVLVDIRQKPMSRKADFRESALRARCQDAGIAYESWRELGSTTDQRRALKTSGDLDAFHRRFRGYAKRYKGEALDRLAVKAKKQRIALLCYERLHDECHRSVIADLLADRMHAKIVAI